METGGADADLGGLPPWAVSTRWGWWLAVSSRRGRGGQAGALLHGPLLDGPAADLYSEFDLFRGLLLRASRLAGYHRAAPRGRADNAWDQPGRLVTDVPRHWGGRGLCAGGPW